MISRTEYIEQLDSAVKRAPVVSLLGPRQSGKTTIARSFANKCSATYFDLESIPARVIVLSNVEIFSLSVAATNTRLGVSGPALLRLQEP